MVRTPRITLLLAPRLISPCYAAVQVLCSPLFVTSLGRIVRGVSFERRRTAMNVILNLCRIAYFEVREVLVQGGIA